MSRLIKMGHSKDRSLMVTVLSELLLPRRSRRRMRPLRPTCTNRRFCASPTSRLALSPCSKIKRLSCGRTVKGIPLSSRIPSPIICCRRKCSDCYLSQCQRGGRLERWRLREHLLLDGRDGKSAVDEDRLPGDVAGQIMEQECHHVGNLFRSANALQRHCRKES